MKKEIWELILNNAHTLHLNMNDTFHYACADGCKISGDDLLDLIPLVEIYGYDAIIAYEAINRGYDPTIKKVVTKNFKNAKEQILKSIGEDKEPGVFFDLSTKIKNNQEEIELFGEEVEYSGYEIIENEGKSIHCVAYLPKKKISATGYNRYQAKKKLIDMFVHDSKYLKSSI